MARRGREADRRNRLALVKAITSLRAAEYRVMHLEQRFRDKITVLNERLVNAKKTGRVQEAQMLAAEIAERMKIINHLEAFRLNLERLRTRLETIRIVGETGPLLKSIEPMISEIRSNMATSIPEVGLIYAQLEERLAELDTGLSLDLPPTTAPNAHWSATEDEVARILKEAEEVARAREGGEMPTPPDR